MKGSKGGNCVEIGARFMRVDELSKKTGLSKGYLRKVYHDQGKKECFAWKQNTDSQNGNSPIMFDVQKFEEWLKKKQKEDQINRTCQ